MIRRPLQFLALGVFAFGCAEAAQPQQRAAGLTLELPVACEIGRTCFIQQYVDADPGPGVRDYRGGPKAYDGHDGTDFRLPTVAAQRAGVAVRAVAAGAVKAIRDGQPDRSGGAGSAADVNTRECGNGVLIAHAGGWETQYCHMAQGSVRVKAGDTIAAGAPLGRIGQSGRAEFPHLHLTVRQAGKAVDPFAGTGLWSPAARAALIYRAPEVINTGFAPAPVTVEQVEAGSAAAPITRASPALVAFVRAIGLQGGDVQTLTVTRPDGAVFIENAIPPLDRAKAQYFLFAGKKNTTGVLPSGLWRARYTVRRGGGVVLDQSFTARF